MSASSSCCLSATRPCCDYCSQPETLAFVAADGRARHYTPDFQVWRTDGRIELHEVTVEARRQAQGVPPPREVAAQLVCQQRGWRYLVHTDQTLPRGYAYANLDIFSAFRVASYADPAAVSWWLRSGDSHAARPTHRFCSRRPMPPTRGAFLSTPLPSALARPNPHGLAAPAVLARRLACLTACVWLRRRGHAAGSEAAMTPRASSHRDIPAPGRSLLPARRAALPDYASGTRTCRWRSRPGDWPTMCACTSL